LNASRIFLRTVTLRLEIALTFFGCELSRRKLRLAIGPLQFAAYLFLGALILSASRTGVAFAPSLLPAPEQDED
jgi:hypothetical protein